MAFEIYVPNKTIVNINQVDSIGEILKENGKRAFIVSSKFLSGQYNRVVKSLEASGIESRVYTDVNAEPDIESVDAAVSDCKEFGAEMVIGIGGGSVLDTSKIVALLIKNEGSVREYLMDEKVFSSRGIFSVAIPTTSGTGSETTTVCVIKNKEEQIKKNILHPYIVPDLVVLDPSLTVSLPKALTASTGLDALSHAIESYVSLFANPITEMYSLKAIELIGKSLERAVKDANDIDARMDMSLGSYLAGISMNAAVGMAHIIGQPVGAVYGISHGDAMAILLPVSMELNLDYAVEKYAKVAEALGVYSLGKERRYVALEGIKLIQDIAVRIGAKQKLSDVKEISKDRFEEVVESVNKSTGQSKSNPRPIDRELIIKALKMAY